MRTLMLPSVLLLFGCAEPTGPVIGDWRGFEQSIDGNRDRVTELILDGTASDRSGTYHLVSSTPSSAIMFNTNSVNWGGRWSRQVIGNGAGAYTVYHLDRPPPNHLPDYVLLSTGALLPVVHPARPDTSPAAMLIALQKLPRTSYGYGRP